ncbi:MAG: histidinol-phosphatase family [Clostridiales bacterium]|nr:histidinol-phosphatase family [Clostridiales bacterium]
MNINKNFHTHTYRCKHAEGDVADYIKMARLKNITALGFSDHTPLPDGWWWEVRMGMEELEGYVEAVLTGRRENPNMRILLGLECDHSDTYVTYYQEIKERYPMDYLVGSIHAIPYQGEKISCFQPGMVFDQKMLTAYADAFIHAMESGLYTFMAHPDLFCLSIPSWNPEALAVTAYILEAAKALSMPLEINCSGIRKSMEMGKYDIAYPRREFWELAASYGVSALVNSDAHTPKCLTDNLDAGYYLLREYGLHEFEL